LIHSFTRGIEKRRKGKKLFPKPQAPGPPRALSTKEGEFLMDRYVFPFCYFMQPCAQCKPKRPKKERKERRIEKEVDNK